MSEWQPLSRDGTCYRRGDGLAVGSLVRLVWAHGFWWEWAVERVNRTGRAQLASGSNCGSRENAQRAADAYHAEKQKPLFPAQPAAHGAADFPTRRT